jgi:hypothetical protein
MTRKIAMHVRKPGIARRDACRTVGEYSFFLPAGVAVLESFGPQMVFRVLRDPVLLMTMCSSGDGDEIDSKYDWARGPKQALADLRARGQDEGRKGSQWLLAWGGLVTRQRAIIRGKTKVQMA